MQARRELPREQDTGSCSLVQLRVRGRGRASGGQAPPQPRLPSSLCAPTKHTATHSGCSLDRTRLPPLSLVC